MLVKKSQEGQGMPKPLAVLTGTLITGILILLLIKKWNNEPWYELAGIMLLLVGTGISMVLLKTRRTEWVQWFFNVWLLGYIAYSMLPVVYEFLIFPSERAGVDWWMGLVCITVILLAILGVRFHIKLLTKRRE